MTELLIPLESELLFAKLQGNLHGNRHNMTYSQPYSIQLCMEDTSGFMYTYHFKDDIASWVNNNIKPVTFDVIPSNQLVAIFDNDVDAILFKMRWL